MQQIADALVAVDLLVPARRTPLSQGEQKVVCYLPLFAAAASVADTTRHRAVSARGTASGSTRSVRDLVRPFAITLVLQWWP
jgi:hypothetical protein